MSKMFDYIMIQQVRHMELCWCLNQMRKAGIAKHKLSVFTNKILQIEDSVSYLMKGKML